MHNNVFTLSVNTNEAFESPFTQINILENKKTRYLPYKLTPLIVEEAKKIDAKLIVCHHPYLYFSVKKAAKILGIPFFIRSHNIESERFKSMEKPWWPLVSWLEKKAYREAQHVFFVTAEDALWAQQHYGLSPERSIVLPYPISSPNFEPTKVSRLQTAALHQLDADLPWYCFMGDLGYAPNEDAVKNIIESIYPRLKNKEAKFEIIICGKGLSDSLQHAIKGIPEIHYLGFVDDLKSILNHAQLMLNAVTFGGGVKVKVLEALSENLTVISTMNGALGINTEVCGNKLKTAPDMNWDAFVNLILEQKKQEYATIPNSFFDFIITKMLLIESSNICKTNRME